MRPRDDATEGFMRHEDLERTRDSGIQRWVHAFSKGVLPRVGHVKEVILVSGTTVLQSEQEWMYRIKDVLVLLVNSAHECCGWGEYLVDKDEDCLLGRQLDSLSNNIDELTDSQILRVIGFQ